MASLARLVGAGVVGLIALKLLEFLAGPVLGAFSGLAVLTIGLLGFVLKVTFVVVVGWLVLRLFRGRRAATA